MQIIEEDFPLVPESARLLCTSKSPLARLRFPGLLQVFWLYEILLGNKSPFDVKTDLLCLSHFLQEELTYLKCFHNLTVKLVPSPNQRILYHKLLNQTSHNICNISRLKGLKKLEFKTIFRLIFHSWKTSYLQHTNGAVQNASGCMW